MEYIKKKKRFPLCYLGCLEERKFFIHKITTFLYLFHYFMFFKEKEVIVLLTAWYKIFHLLFLPILGGQKVVSSTCILSLPLSFPSFLLSYQTPNFIFSILQSIQHFSSFHFFRTKWTVKEISYIYNMCKAKYTAHHSRALYRCF